jgi:hypothetical protein
LCDEDIKYDDKGRLRLTGGGGSMALPSSEDICLRNEGKSADLVVSEDWNISRKLPSTFASNDSIALSEGWAAGDVPPPACSAGFGGFI